MTGSTASRLTRSTPADSVPSPSAAPNTMGRRPARRFPRLAAPTVRKPAMLKR